MNKTADRTVALDKGRVDIYTKNGVTLYAYQTRDLIDNEAFVLAKKGRGVVIELPCFFDNIRELTDFLKSEGVTVEAKFVAYHAAGASFLPEVPAYGEFQERIRRQLRFQHLRGGSRAGRGRDRACGHPLCREAQR